jgi:molybdenum cofactor cytidylyltransferase
MTTPGEPRVAAVLLAAGGSTRMGSPKQLIELDGSSLIRRSAEVASRARCERLFVVAGAHSEAIREELVGLQATVLVAENWREGLSQSIRCGVDAVDRAADPRFDAILLVLADQPKVTSAHLDGLIDLYPACTAAMVATQYADTLGVPAVFGRRHFEALRSLEGDRGAKELLLAAPATGRVPFEPAALDIDTPDDLAGLSS